MFIQEQNRIQQAVQVTYDMSSQATRAREIKGLVEAMMVYKLKEGWIITQYEESEETWTEGEDTFLIHVVPIWKWLLQIIN